MYSLIVVFEKIHWSTSLGGAYERMNALSRGEGVNLCRIFAKYIGLYCTALHCSALEREGGEGRYVPHYKLQPTALHCSELSCIEGKGGGGGIMGLIINCTPSLSQMH